MPYKFLKSLFLCTLFAFFVQFEAQSQCATYSVSVNPEPVAGALTYVAGQTVEFCVNVSDWDFTDGNPLVIGQIFFHGVQPLNIGPAWEPLNASSGTAGPVACSSSAGGVGWFWTDHPTLGWGWYFESPNVTIPIDNDPSNNFGDANNIPGAPPCTWDFCFEMVASGCPPGVEGQNLDLTIATYSDSASGADVLASACSADVNWTQNAVLTCCSNPLLAITPIADVGTGTHSICPDDDLILTAELDLASVPSATVVNYFWEGPQFWNSTDEDPILINPAPGLYTVFVEVDGCSSQVYTLDVEIETAPDLSWTVPFPICGNDPVLILEPDPGAITGGTWSGDGVTDVGDGTAQFEPSAVSGSSMVTYAIPPGGGCPAFQDNSVNVVATPIAPTVNPIDPICSGDPPPPTLVATPDNAANFLRWYTDASGDESTFIDMGNSITFPTSIDLVTIGITSLWVLERSTDGCKGPATEVVISIVNCSCPFFSSNSDITSLRNVCDTNTWSELFGLENPSEGTLTWLYPDGTTEETNEPEYEFDMVEACGEMQYIDWSIFCTATGDSETGTIDFIVSPELDDSSVTITETGNADECAFISIVPDCPHFEISLTDNNGPVSGLEYQVQEGQAGSLEILIEQPTGGIFCLTHSIDYDYNCGAEPLPELPELPPLPEVKVPTAFSPNGDGVNDYFSPFVEEPDAIEFIVYSRWGKEVFRSNDLLNRWNGTQGGNALPVGGYIYYVIATFAGRQVKESGSLTLVR